MPGTSFLGDSLDRLLEIHDLDGVVDAEGSVQQVYPESLGFSLLIALVGAFLTKAFAACFGVLVDAIVVGASIKLSNLAIFCNIWMQRLFWGSVISTPPVYQKRRHLSLCLRCRFSKCIFMSRCCKDKKTFSKTNKVFIFLHHQTTKQKNESGTI